MASRFEFGSKRAVCTFIGFLVIFGALLALHQRFSILNFAVIAMLWAFYLICSVVIVIRMWRTRSNPDEFWKSAHGGEASVLRLARNVVKTVRGR